MIQTEEIFGQVRYMNAQGLKRKFSIADYLRRVNDLVPDPGSSNSAPGV